ncbi:MAG: HisS family protein, partial [Acidobacteriota bacterium]
KFFKRYQIQPVWRADRPARGRFREFYQCDVDVLGSKSMVVEAEICAAACEALTKLGFTDFTLRLNHRQLLTGVLASAGVALDKHDAALIALDKLDKVGPAGVAAELEERGIAESAGKKLLNFFETRRSWDHAAGLSSGEDSNKKREGLNAATIGRLVEFVGATEIGAQGIDAVRAIMKFAAAAGVAGRIEIDPSLARGLSYYTGAIMEINSKDLAGSLGGGGRYDNLVGMFLGQDIPACGFSLGLERIIVLMTEREMFPPALSSSPAEIMVSVWSDESVTEALELAQEIRSAGLRVDVYPEPDKLGKQFKYASSRGIPFVAVIGEDERVRGEVSIKDLRTGEQQSIKRASVAEAIRIELNKPENQVPV